jgi:hypothetical protein
MLKYNIENILLARITQLTTDPLLVPTFANRGCHVVSVTDSYGRILHFLDQSCYFSFQVAPQLYSRGTTVKHNISL